MRSKDFAKSAAVLIHPAPTDLSGSAGVNEFLVLAVIEVMTSNCLFIVSAAAAVPELVEHEVSGLVVL